MEGPISDLTRNKFKLLSGTEQTSSKVFIVPFPEKGTIYDYQFIPEVSSEARCVTASLAESLVRCGGMWQLWGCLPLLAHMSRWYELEEGMPALLPDTLSFSPGEVIFFLQIRGWDNFLKCSFPQW